MGEGAITTRRRAPSIRGDARRPFSSLYGVGGFSFSFRLAHAKENVQTMGSIAMGQKTGAMPRSLPRSCSGMWPASLATVMTSGQAGQYRVSQTVASIAPLFDEHYTISGL